MKNYYNISKWLKHKNWNFLLTWLLILHSKIVIISNEMVRWSLSLPSWETLVIPAFLSSSVHIRVQSWSLLINKCIFILASTTFLQLFFCTKKSNSKPEFMFSIFLSTTLVANWTLSLCLVFMSNCVCLDRKLIIGILIKRVSRCNETIV